MKDLSKVFIDLSKCSEEQIKKIARVIEVSGGVLDKFTKPYIDSGSIDRDFNCLAIYEDVWACWRNWAVYDHNKTELTYPEFIRLFEGAEGKKSNPTAQLQADKAELLEALEIFFPMFTELDSEFGIENPPPRKWTEAEIATVQKISDLIQKHKQ